MKTGERRNPAGEWRWYPGERVAKVVLLVALALIVSSVQCAAACTPVSSATPPSCHHHKQAPKANCHELVPATTVQFFAVSLLFSTEPVEVSPISGTGVQIVRNPHQPILNAPPLTVLRI
jgi:hypothetical protein